MSSYYQFGEFVLDVGRGCVIKGDTDLKLRPKVYQALKYLVEHPGQLIGKQELMQAVWPDSFVTDDSLVQCALELRRALDDRNQQLFKTVPRRGYLFTAEVIERTSKDPVRDLHEAKTKRRHRNLPSPRTSLIGREQQLTDATDLLLRNDVRVLTLTGPGGAGKTRLAIAVATAIAEHFMAGIQFVGLASISQPEMVATALADALEIQQVANRTLPQLIREQLGNSSPFLLLLDNFEQVLPAATLVAEILETCPSFKVLVTSRLCLGIYRDQVFPVVPLAPDSAIELFVQRAAAVLPGFSVTPENAVAVREICQRLDGLPLAIELAAARSKVLPAKAILDRLQHRLQLLTGGPLDLPERQQTLRKTIDWSYGLLNDDERKLFRRVSVFAGHCTLEAAEAVCNTNRDLGIDLFEGLSSLVDKNLVQCTDRTEAEPRFAMLETMREYAQERLAECGEEANTRRAHAAYCLVLAEEGNPELSSDDRARWLEQYDAEVDNLRSALDWLLQTKNLDWALRLCVASFRFWDMREHLTEGRIRIEAVLRLAGSEHLPKRAKLTQFLGALATSQGDYAAAQSYLEQSLSLYEDLGDEWGTAVSLNALAVAARDRGDYAASQANFERSLACWRLLPDRPAIARCLHNLANVVRIRGDYARAQWALGEAVSIFEELGDRTGAAWAINQQGDIARAQSAWATARELYQRALSTFREAADPWGSARSLTDLAFVAAAQGDYLAGHTASREALDILSCLGNRRGIARALESAAYLALSQGHPTRALELAAAATHLRQSINATQHVAEQSKLDQTLLPAWKALSGPEGKLAWTRGSTMSLENAIQLAVAFPEEALTA